MLLEGMGNRMRASLFCGIVVGVIGHVTASAQGTRAAGAGQDFYGVYVAPIYVAVPEVSQPDVFPFTAEGERAHDEYDVFSAAPNQADDCAAESMPGVLWSGDPMEILQEDGRLVFHYERRNTVRTIHMDGAPPPEDEPHTGLGFSVGRWEGDELWIETTHMRGGVIRANRPWPISPEGRVTERYWREPGGDTLHMELLVDDPLNYTATVTFGREWVFSPEDEVLPWECVSLGPRDSEPDIDELARMLEEL